MPVIDWRRSLEYAQRVTFLFLQVRHPVRVRRMDVFSLPGTSLIGLVKDKQDFSVETELVRELRSFKYTHDGRSRCSCRRSGENAPKAQQDKPSSSLLERGYWATWGIA